MDSRFPALALRIRKATRALRLSALPLGEWIVFSAVLLLLLGA